MTDDIHVELSGSKLPMVAIAVGFTALISAVIYATVWLTKLDDRVLTNAEHIGRIQSEIGVVTKTLVQVQSNCAKQTFILNHIVKDMDNNE